MSRFCWERTPVTGEVYVKRVYITEYVIDEAGCAESKTEGI